MSKALFWLCTLVCAASLLIGCKKGSSSGSGATVDAQTLEAAQKLPDGTNVLAALDKKDYEAAVSTITKIQQDVSGQEQLNALFYLKQHVKETLLTASETDPKAKDALTALRFLTQGR